MHLSCSSQWAGQHVSRQAYCITGKQANNRSCPWLKGTVHPAGKPFKVFRVGTASYLACAGSQMSRSEHAVGMGKPAQAAPARSDDQWVLPNPG